MTQKQQQSPPSPEWSYLIDEEDAGTAVIKLSLEPNAEEKSALAERLNLVSLDSLKAEIAFEKQSGGMITHITGRLEADLTQSCVVTLEPVQDHVEENFEAWYADPEKAVSFAKERRDRKTEKTETELEMLEEWEDPEPAIEGKINLGEMVTQYLSLAINPYPHAEGVEPPEEEDKIIHEEIPEARKNPFAALKDWKEKLNQDDK